MKRAEGTFEVDFRMQPSQDTRDGVTIGRAAVTKKFHGDLVGTSETEIITVHSSIPASYAGIERVEGMLHGRKGGFVLQHSAGTREGKPWMRWEIVETTGSGELEGIRGQGQIDVAADGTHSYWIEYEL